MSEFWQGVFVGWGSALIGIVYYFWASKSILKAKDRMYHGDYK